APWGRGTRTARNGVKPTCRPPARNCSAELPAPARQSSRRALPKTSPVACLVGRVEPSVARRGPTLPTGVGPRVPAERSTATYAGEDFDTACPLLCVCLPLSRSGRRFALPQGGPLGGEFAERGPEHPDGRPPADGRLDLDVPAGRPDEFADGREAQAGAGRALGREERVEEARLHLVGHARAGVGHGEC